MCLVCQWTKHPFPLWHLFKKCLLKHTALRVDPLWCHRGHQYLSNPPQSLAPLCFSPLLLPARGRSHKATVMAGSSNPATKTSLILFQRPPCLSVHLRTCLRAFWSGGTTSRCSCLWTFCLFAGWGLCFGHVTRSLLVEGAEELQDVWVVKTTWDGAIWKEDDWKGRIKALVDKYQAGHLSRP